MKILSSQFKICLGQSISCPILTESIVVIIIRHLKSPHAAHVRHTQETARVRGMELGVQHVQVGKDGVAEAPQRALVHVRKGHSFQLGEGDGEGAAEPVPENVRGVLNPSRKRVRLTQNG